MRRSVLVRHLRLRQERIAPDYDKQLEEQQSWLLARPGRKSWLQRLAGKAKTLVLFLVGKKNQFTAIQTALSSFSTFVRAHAGRNFAALSHPFNTKSALWVQNIAGTFLYPLPRIPTHGGQGS